MFDLTKPVIGYADGGSRGNPGPASFGAVLTQGELELALKMHIGIATCNVAEYTGLIFALKKAIELGIDSLEMRMDSELVVRQMKGEYKVKHPGLKPLHQEACELASRLVSFRIIHVRREYNKRADELANQALDELAA